MLTMTTKEIETTCGLIVAEGAKFLDKKEPNWFRLVDEDRLNMSDCLDCMLGQLFGTYEDAISEFDLTRSERSRLGFSCDQEHYFAVFGTNDRTEQVGEIFGRLIKQAWIKLIQQRRLVDTRRRKSQ